MYIFVYILGSFLSHQFLIIVFIYTRTFFPPINQWISSFLCKMKTIL